MRSAGLEDLEVRRFQGSRQQPYGRFHSQVIQDELLEGTFGQGIATRPLP